ncbi:hypothetical protein ONZ45_g12302 [Pleurotus djamor]|nr:hypothetical protein ONZ45_g12302 [Pleurotus djamor]
MPTSLALSVFITLFYLWHVRHTTATPLMGPSHPSPAIPEATPKRVIIQLFQWDWDSIAKECTEFIGPSGYGFVQVSPPAEHVEGSEWWTDYQPVSYKIISKRGNRQQFASMVRTCKAAGVGVIVDTLWNHMTGRESGTGVGGSKFSNNTFPSYYTNEDFHQCDKVISNYGDRKEVQECKLVGLADLATGKNRVQQQLASYANDLISMGVEGLRLDAAKRKSLISASRPVYVSQEVTVGPVEAVKPEEYTMNGAVQIFPYTLLFKTAFEQGNIASLKDLHNRGWVPSDHANVFVANHDTERYGDSLNYKTSHYPLALIFSLGHSYGRNPTILSGYEFPNKDVGAPNQGKGVCNGDGMGDNGGWVCQHRWPGVAGMVSFRNAVGDSEMRDWVSPLESRVAFGRGALGFVAINAAKDPWTTEFHTSMPDGQYCNVLLKTCNDATRITVTMGKFSATIRPNGALAIHMMSKALPSPLDSTQRAGHGVTQPLIGL